MAENQEIPKYIPGETYLIDRGKSFAQKVVLVKALDDQLGAITTGDMSNKAVPITILLDRLSKID